ncbi:MAG: formylglycine-generating enzyme family protein [Gemmatimonadota bacterium]|uniref:formylglycine-generating enzyme family protein n=1 Tax=Candidatus Palauibacter scopulicola TaxID=3056741 RepID=UPI0023A2AAA2|nr:formylglycine-generating enzyme family protein [Candidatus Palauibacter scopulicola]MDE2664454.1 formylglycine-generating enzyme family protein [Candidatus Palauibacter scopulicola]
MKGPRRTLAAVTAAHAGADLLLLAGGILAESLPAAAQSDASPSPPGAVVCVGSELSTPRTPDPDRRFGWEGITVVYRSDVALAYRVGVRLEDRQRVERALRSELGDHAEASCAWSNRGDRHVAIIGYTSSVRLAPTSDPDGSAFERIAVGFGASAEAAETNATTGNDHFARYYDGGGYEVVARESWGAVGDGAASGTADRPPEEMFEAFETFRDCAFCPEMVVVPPGTFTMGSPESEEFRGAVEGPQHSVTIGAPFAVGVYEVTFAEWDACVQMGGCRYTPADRRWGRERRPVLYVSWEDAQAYVLWLSGLTGQPYRLLSEAEWEYVARAGTVTARHWGNDVSDLCRYANGAGGGPRARSFRGLRFSRGSGSEPPCNDGYGGTAPVGSFAPNAFGLYDVLGNVSEWTQDCWNDSYSGAPADGSARESGDCDRRVLRGGSWFIGAWFLRSANRSRNLPDSRDMYYGFRVARSLP